MDKFIGKRLDGRYEIHDLLGVGGMAYVYRAYDRIENRWVAIKILKEELSDNSEFLRRFRNESKAIAVLSHPNIVKVYDVSFGDRIQYIVMEFIDGITVADAMIGEHYDYPTAKKALIGVCDALTLLHEHRLVHRDVKPENVMVTPDGRVVLIDFNASRQITSAEKDTVIMGTFGYIAPEQLGVLQSDVRTDIYAVGVLLNVMLTGKHPSEEIVKGRAGHIVRKCTAVNPDERYQSAQKLVDAL